MAPSLKRFFIINFYVIFSLKFSTASLFFPTNSAFGIFAAIAIPLDLPHRNVFLSYNIEANYNLPFEHNIPPVLNGIEDEDFNSRQCKNCTVNKNYSSSENANSSSEDNDTTANANEAEMTTESITETVESTTDQPKTKKAKERQERSLLSRKYFYHILMDKLKRSGFEGKECLLRLICEMNSSDLGDINGILGHLLHIIFTPSTSIYEELPLAFYQAEIDGVHDQCKHYHKGCKKNLLDLISVSLVDVLENMMPSK